MDEAHPWHAWPTYAGMVPGYLAVLPVLILEDVVGDARNLGACPAPGPVGEVFIGAAGAPGFVLGGAFWIVGSPLELVVDPGEDSVPAPEKPPGKTGEGESP